MTGIEALRALQYGYDDEELQRDLERGRCLHVLKSFVWYPTSNGRKQLRQQCDDCGDLVGPGALPFAKAEGQTVKAFDLQRYQQARREHNEATREAYERARQRRNAVWATQRLERQQQYQAYLQSEQWRRLRVKLLKRAGYTCEGCLEARATEVHHVTYEHIFQEYCFELRALCAKCHGRLHANGNADWD
jgi:hypothetical protein